MPVHFAAIPGQIAGGLVLLALLAGATVDTWLEDVHAGLIQLPAQ